MRPATRNAAHLSRGHPGIPWLSLLLAAVMVLALVTLPAGCGADPEARSKVREAESLIESSKPLLDDLLDLDSRFNLLGTRFSDVNDTIAEGKSLAEMAMVDVDELESRMTRAASLLGEVAEAEGAGDYAEYARLVLAALDDISLALARNRELLAAVWDMLDLMPSAESVEQLSFYTREIDRLAAEINALLREASAAAEEADRFREERGL